MILLSVAPIQAAAPAASAEARAKTPQAVAISVSLAGRDVRRIGAGEPLRLSPSLPLRLDLDIVNHSRAEVFVRSVRLTGKVFALTFFSYEVQVGIAVPAGETAQRTILIDLVDLDHQAMGRMPARFTVLDRDRHVISTMALPVEVRGSYGSVYGAFVLIFAAASLLLLGRAISHARDPERAPVGWRAGASFAVAGVLLGLAASLDLSIAGVLAPGLVRTVLLAGFGGAVCYGLGWLIARRRGPYVASRVEDDREEGAEDIDLREMILRGQVTGLPSEPSPLEPLEPTMADSE